MSPPQNVESGESPVPDFFLPTTTYRYADEHNVQRVFVTRCPESHSSIDEVPHRKLWIVFIHGGLESLGNSGSRTWSGVVRALYDAACPSGPLNGMVTGFAAIDYRSSNMPPTSTNYQGQVRRPRHPDQLYDVWRALNLLKRECPLGAVERDYILWGEDLGATIAFQTLATIQALKERGVPPSGSVPVNSKSPAPDNLDQLFHSIDWRSHLDFQDPILRLPGAIISSDGVYDFKSISSRDPLWQKRLEKAYGTKGIEWHRLSPRDLRYPSQATTELLPLIFFIRTWNQETALVYGQEAKNMAITLSDVWDYIVEDAAALIHTDPSNQPAEIAIIEAVVGRMANQAGLDG